jgi:hypothetical protein
LRVLTNARDRSVGIFRSCPHLADLPWAGNSDSLWVRVDVAGPYESRRKTRIRTIPDVQGVAWRGRGSRNGGSGWFQPALVCADAGGMASKEIVIVGGTTAPFADVPADAQRLVVSSGGSTMDSGIVFSRRLPAPIIVMGLRAERRTSATKLCDADRCRRCERDATTINAAPTDSATRTEQAGPVANRCRTSTWGKASRHASRASRIEVSSRVGPRSHTCSVVRPTRVVGPPERRTRAPPPAPLCDRRPQLLFPLNSRASIRRTVRRPLRDAWPGERPVCPPTSTMSACDRTCDLAQGR